MTDFPLLSCLLLELDQDKLREGEEKLNENELNAEIRGGDAASGPSEWIV